jgi:flagellar biosynthesis chaperone FliJ
LFRLLQVRQLEEEGCRTALESTLAKLNRLVDAQKIAVDRERQGRIFVLEGLRTGQLSNRLAGLEEVRVSRVLQSALSAKIDAAGQEVNECRGRYLEKRIERRQLEMLIEAAQAKKAQQASRRAQEMLDDRHRSRTHLPVVARKLALKAQSEGCVIRKVQ